MSGKLISLIVGVVIVFVVLAIVFPDSTKGFMAKVDTQREKIEKSNTAESSIELIKKEIEDMENEYNSKLEKIAEVKVKKMNLEKEIEDIESKIKDYEEKINKLAEIYRSAKNKGKNEVEIGTNKYKLNELKEKAEILKNEIDENLSKQLELKKEIYGEITESLNNANKLLKEYRTKIEEEKARLARVTAKKMKLDMKKELEGFEEDFMTGKYTKTGEEIEKALDEEIMKYDAKSETMNSEGLEDINKLTKELDEVETKTNIKEEIDKLFDGE
ncbi:coiled-coil domain-containing protein [Marinitoga aeolica]|uniref:Phage shock protein A (IM30), suppresses sigma54-dependent transcription n=1 Tax=Marinitoga aeolica TaxID=2809031 RepID=A0ABY8PRE8_9BACT|nr:hypothetical protein [Marinitoga aeolica]WGS65186.1 hypothetical protein JRV97_01115 [Marinitoga aeolica]